MNTLIKTAATIALGTAAAFASPAAAGDAPQVSVSYADLNLSNESGVQILDRRIDKAISNVCGGMAPRDVSRNLQFKACVKETTALVQPKRDLAVSDYREGRLAMRERVIRFAAQ